jgi:hypothetical protein
MNLTTEKLRKYIKSMIKTDTIIIEDDNYIYFTTKDILDGIILADLGFTIEYKTEADGYTIRATKPEWLNKNDIMNYLNICSDVHNIEETDTHIYFNTDNIETIFDIKNLGYKYTYQEHPTTGMYRVSVCKK